MIHFKGKRALVTGAASGIGRAVAVRLGALGAHVTLGDINEAGLAETAAIIGEGVSTCVFDAMDFTSCAALVDTAAKGDGLDIVCNIAGALDWGVSADFAPERFARIVQINLNATFAICHSAIPHLTKTKGVIVNTASTAGLIGIPYSAAYTASKHGVAGLTKSLAVELASSGVRVNAVCPGHVNTPMTSQTPPEGEINWPLVMRNAPKLPDGTLAPEEVAEAIVWLASDAAKKMTGTLLTMDGGQVAG
ncbi:MAG: SDR family NAD(P)-dependent oxidoreductase [Maricaulaceae bacterium]